ncbi:leucine-rich repeat protein 1-like [Ziziphus jujuba]|uniref:Leucine-rich repeat protein 1-like n=1 Tax=Ziziphus jujuba TaxID=326968 RepID=A0ABM4A3J3_ZIZJJ|nr:leucine-rich repeat protein 1-like [Ziziphus jujuba]
MTRLRFLVVAENYLDGSIPPEIGMLESLEVFYAYNNNISGSIPVSVGNLSRLITLALPGNNINGSTCEMASGLDNETFDARSTGFTAHMPTPTPGVQMPPLAPVTIPRNQAEQPKKFNGANFKR